MIYAASTFAGQHVAKPQQDATAVQPTTGMSNEWLGNYYFLGSSHDANVAVTLSREAVAFEGSGEATGTNSHSGTLLLLVAGSM